MSRSGDWCRLLVSLIDGGDTPAMGLAGAMGFSLFGALLWVVLAIVGSAPVLLLGLPLFAIGFVLGFVGWAAAMRAEARRHDPEREVRIAAIGAGMRATGVVAVSLVFTLAGFAVPFWVMNASL